jgi:hypothetical protein
LIHDHGFPRGEEIRRTPKKTQTPGSFHEFDDFDWGESDESEEEEDLSRGKDVWNQNQDQIPKPASLE